MKYITELTEEEILQLSQEDLDRMVKFKMALDGLKFFIKPEEPTYHQIPEPDQEVYLVEGVEYTFIKEEDALKVAKILKDMLPNLYARTWRHKDKLETIIDYDLQKMGIIRTINVYSRELWSEIDQKQKENNESKAAYETLLEQYNKAYEAADYIRDEVYGRYDDVVNKYEGFKTAVENFKEYLELAEGKIKQAMIFYKKAYSPDEETITYIKKHYRDEGTTDQA